MAEVEALLERWKLTSLSMEERDALLEELQRAGAFPRLMTAMDEWESEGGLYPDLEDPRFTEKLMAKQEFAEAKQNSIAEQQEEGVDPCDPDKEFELTPVQRFVGRFLSPQCPYQSALLYHGVGVGKTCAAVTVAENYLRAYPRRSVIIVAPRNIQSGFKRTIFDDEALQIPAEEDAPNVAKGCTGNSYLKRTGSEFEKEKGVIQRRVTQSINSRYTILGYIQFHRYIEDILRRVPKGLDDAAAKAAATRLLRREFSGRLLIIDEAHNLRDSPGESVDDNRDAAGGDTELAEASAGKKLTPSLLKVLDAAEGMKFVLLSGTPMYNSFKEIVFLLNLLLANDKKGQLSERDIFLPTGAFKPGGEELLGAAANAYVSFMRGENPLSFPVRIPPPDEEVMKTWPPRDPTGAETPEEERGRMIRLPFVAVEYEGESQGQYQRISEEAIEAGGVGVNSIDEMVQSGNWIFPGEEGVQIRDMGFDACFRDTTAGVGGEGSGASVYESRTGAPRWLQVAELGKASPKAKFTIEKLRGARGVAFVYSRFIKSGALPFALALEANGYTAWERDRPLLTNGIQDGQGRQCALCPRREKAHAGAGHKFVPAKYVLITGKSNLSPRNPLAIQAARAKSNMDGREIKVIIGSSVASEGVDFRFVREIYVFDSWYHLNKMEQVLGRGIRTCSHALLPIEQRNCTIHLLVNRFAGDQDTETADMYMYRRGMVKAVQVGRVTRVLKRYALDCNLNRDAILVTGLQTQRHVDSQGKVREEVNVNDTPFTNLCDWIETCDYTCAKPVEIDEEHMDTSTYDEYAARWREAQLKKAIRGLFQTRRQPIFRLEEIQDMFSAVPAPAVAGLLSEIVGNRSFRLRLGSVDGYVVYRNGYYMFQPDYLSDIRIPLALRVASIPVKKDTFEPTTIRVLAPGGQAPGGQAPGGVQPAASGATTAPAAIGGPASVERLWDAVSAWATAIRGQTARVEDIPEEVKEAVRARFTGDEVTRESERLIMVNWLYDHIQTSEDYEPAAKQKYLDALATVLLDFVWDESLRGTEQLVLLRKGGEAAKATAKEQMVKKGSTEAFRFVDPITGILRYICGEGACSEAVKRVLDSDVADPINQIQVNRDATGAIYGFLVPKSKEGRLIFKTSDRPPAPGGKPEKGGECAIVSTISYHIKMLKDIGELMTAEGFPRFIVTDDVLDDKARRKKEKEGAKAAGRKSAVTPARNPRRSFENALRACALKDIILRWMTVMTSSRGGTGAGAGAPQPRRYFYRPVAALKTGHKGIIAK